jgi:NAD(P)H-dependent flavin oxidoreductase YrpB (nitropropane dioxygenase family)
MRVLRNGLTDAWAGREAEVPTADRPIIGQTNLLGQVIDLPKFTNFIPIPTTESELDEMPLLAGQGVGMIEAVEPVGEILKRMAEDAARILGGLAQGCTNV